ncbi:major vault protein [Plakobranchus ocellatus]|uniref:Major vault protein n=1 Tax=Plakobranchus ocellatus TaxID=259542 RepID=A0AAV4CBW2_9GAST|nr:major vault protein [Plakobranchus ocellatus]
MSATSLASHHVPAEKNQNESFRRPDAKRSKNRSRSRSPRRDRSRSISRRRDRSRSISRRRDRSRSFNSRREKKRSLSPRRNWNRFDSSPEADAMPSYRRRERSSSAVRDWSPSRDSTIVRIPPCHYLHVLDQNTNVTSVVLGPQTFVRQDNQRIEKGPCRMVVVPPRHYCVVENPVVKREEAEEGGTRVAAPVLDALGQAKLRHGELEIRFAGEPFPLYPGELLKQPVKPLKVVQADTALKVRAILDFDEYVDEEESVGGEGGAAKTAERGEGSGKSSGKSASGRGRKSGDVPASRRGVEEVEQRDMGKRIVHRAAGDVWLFEGPGTFMPRIETIVEETVRASVITPNQALRLRATKECVDRSGRHRVTGEEWLVKEIGAYLPGVYEEVVDVVKAFVLTEKQALHVRALKTFVDDFGVSRNNGEEWLITMTMTDAHIPGVYEEVLGLINITTLSPRQYCVIIDPVGTDGKPQYGQKKLVRGDKSFFLMPGEKLEKGIQNVYVLGEEEGLVLKALEGFSDGNVQRHPGDRWMIKGPLEYVPPVEVEVVMKRRTIPLHESEGIYIRDIKTGNVRAVTGSSYMIKEDEELWEKQLSDTVEALLASNKDPLADRSIRPDVGKGEQVISKGETDAGKKPGRDKTRVITFRVPHNAACQIYDYRAKLSRVIYGPELAMLGPDEQFTQLSLSGGKPKKQNVIKALCLLLGPDFATDIITVETADHARLSLQLAYNWHFDVSDKSPEASAKLFSVPDFIGDSCKAIASRVRGAVAQTPFDDFHKHSTKIIRSSVFGFSEGRFGEELRFPQNNLVVTSVDIQSVEPVDQRTRDALQKSVQMAIEITTKSQEAAARHEAERLEQEARGRLERQKIQDEAEAEKARRELLELQAQSAAVESTGQAKAEAQSRAEASRIEGETAVEQAKLKAEAMAIEAEAELKRLSQAREAELEYVVAQDKQQIYKSAELNNQEIHKFEQMVASLGSGAIVSMATAGKEHQLKMLEALGLKSTLITDGSSPINLLSTAAGLIGAGVEELMPPAAKRRKVDDAEVTSAEDDGA